MNSSRRAEHTPEIESLLQSADTISQVQEEAMAASRKNTALIPSAGYVPVISQTQPISGSKGALGSGTFNAQNGTIASPTFDHGGSNMNYASAHQRTRMKSRSKTRKAVFALAASVALLAGVVFLSQNGNFSAHNMPAAPPASSHFNPADPSSLNAFGDSGGISLTGRIRPNLPADPANLRTTGWVITIYVIGESGGGIEKGGLNDLIKSDEPAWTMPIDLSGFNTQVIEQGFLKHPMGVLAVIQDGNNNSSVVTPIASPYGVLVSDPLLLANSSTAPDESRSLRTLDGQIVDSADTPLSYSVLAQFADFPMKYSFTDTPTEKSLNFKSAKVHSQVNAEAQACIAVETSSGNKILSFPTGSTASTSQEDPSIPEPVSSHPLRISSPKKPGDLWDGTSFTFDALTNATTSFKAWPTGDTGTCANRTGEIINFAGLQK